VSLAQVPSVFDFNFDFDRQITPAVRLNFGWDNSSLREEDKKTLTNSLSSYGLDLGFTSTQDFFPIIKKTYYAFSDKIISDADKQIFNSALTDNSFWGLGLSMSHFNSSNSTHNNYSGAFIITPVRLDGSGYKIGNNVNLKFLTGSNMAWYILDNDMKLLPPSEEPNEYADIGKFGSGSLFRFGTKYRSEVSFQFAKGISISGEANRMIIFPRTLFWKYLGSEMIYDIGSFTLEYFMGKIKTSNPYVYPVVDFILKTGLNFGMSELQKNKMNWPFNSAVPLMVEQYRVGLQFEFSLKK